VDNLISKLTQHGLSLPPVKWRDWFDSLDRKEREEVEKDLHSLAERSVRLGRYFAWRSLREHDHAGAVKQSNKAVTATRRALKYTYPDACEFNF
jgi:hypothetical protein